MIGRMDSSAWLGYSAGGLLGLGYSVRFGWAGSYTGEFLGGIGYRAGLLAGLLDCLPLILCFATRDELKHSYRYISLSPPIRTEPCLFCICLLVGFGTDAR